MGSHDDPQRVVPLAEHFRALWEAGGASPDVFAFLASHPEATTRDRLEVILVDQKYQWRQGRKRSIGDYLAALPDPVDLPGILAQLSQGESQTPPCEDNPAESETAALPLESSSLTTSGSVTFDEPTARREQTEEQAAVSGLSAAMGVDWSVATELLTTADAARLASEELGSVELRAGANLEMPDAGGSPVGSRTRFTIQDRLGSGGMGVVYRALDRERGETIALKTMRHVDPVALYRFKHEFRTLADLTHPNLVSLYELIAVGNLWFFTMELIEGIDFISFVSRGPVQPDESEAAQPGKSDIQRSTTTGRGAADELRRDALLPSAIGRLRWAMRQLAEGVHVLHEAGKLHRDIKPTNVLVTAEGRVVLLDFGLAANLERSGSLHNSEGQIVGTISYMSPEQAGGSTVSPSSDWYSVGVMLYEGLTGRLPHQGRATEILRKKMTVDPPRPSALLEGVPEDLSQLCMELLNRKPENRPSGREVLSRLLTSPVNYSAAPGVGALTPLVGRAAHLKLLNSAFTMVKSGKPLVIALSGRSGSGKSTLLQSFLEDLSIAGEAVILTGRCYERESVPYKALDSLLDALSRYLKELPEEQARGLLPDDISLLARLFPVLQGVEVVAKSPRPAFESPDRFELRRRATAVLRELLTRIAHRQPLVLAIDDLQWGDIDSAMLLLDLMQPPQPPPLLLLGSYRSEDIEQSAFLRAIKSLGAEGPSGSWRRELAVEPLTLAESRELALELLGRSGASAQTEAQVIARESKGNPLFIYELVGYVQSDAGLAEPSSSARGVALDAVLWSRIQRLSPRCRRLLETVAVSGRPLSQSAAFGASELGPEGRAAVIELCGSRLARATGPSQRDEVEVYHDQIRETVVRHLSPAELEMRHQLLAVTLEARGHADLELLAVHFEGGGDQDRAGHYYAQAADRTAEALAFVHAAKLYRKAIELRAGATGGENGRLWTKLGDALANAGRGPESAQAYFTATATANAAEAFELQRRATMQLLISGHVDEGIEALRKVLRPMGMTLPTTPRRALASLLVRRALLRLRGLSFRSRDESQVSAEHLTRIDLCWTAVAGLSIIDPILGADFQARGFLLALRAGEPYRIARAIAMEAAHVSTAGGPGICRFEHLMKIAEPLAERVGQPHARAMTTLARALSLLMLGEWRSACLWFERAEDLFRNQCTGTAWELDTVHNLSLWGLLHMGDLNAVRQRWPILIKEARERGDLYAETTLNTYYMTMLKLADRDDQEPERELDMLMKRWTQRGFHVQHSTAFRARFHLLLYRGDIAGASNLVQSVWPLFAKSMLLRLQMIRIEMHEIYARCMLALAATSRNFQPLLHRAERDVRRLEREKRPWASAYARFLQAGIALRRGQRSRSCELLRESASRFDACDMRLNAVVARRCLGEMIGGPEGKALLAQAGAWMNAQGIQDPVRWTAMYAPGFAKTNEESM
jgi:serine/threonine protein kinase